MYKKSLILMFTGVVILANAGKAKAQFADPNYIPMDISHMVQSNIDFDRKFNEMCWQQSLALGKLYAQAGKQVPFNAMTISAANREAQKAFDSYNQQWHVNSNRTSNAVSNWTNNAIRGQGPYQGTNGQVYNLPWTHNQYHMNNYGQFVPGYSPYHMSVYPYYGN